MFDVKKEKWFIRVVGEQESAAAQQWAFKQGLGWSTGPLSKEVRTDSGNWDTKGGDKAIGCGHFGGGCLGQASTAYWEKHGHKEIKLTYAFAVDTVTYPEVESPQQKQIKALEATIALAAAQIQKIKEEM